MCQDPLNDLSRLKIQLQTALSERGVFEIKINQMQDDLKQMLSEKNDVKCLLCSVRYVLHFWHLIPVVLSNS